VLSDEVVTCDRHVIDPGQFYAEAFERDRFGTFDVHLQEVDVVDAQRGQKCVQALRDYRDRLLRRADRAVAEVVYAIAKFHCSGFVGRGNRKDRDVVKAISATDTAEAVRRFGMCFDCDDATSHSDEF